MVKLIKTEGCARFRNVREKRRLCSVCEICVCVLCNIDLDQLGILSRLVVEHPLTFSGKIDEQNKVGQLLFKRNVSQVRPADFVPQYVLAVHTFHLSR